jgi:uncharacterized protein (DUF1697 family)
MNYVALLRGINVGGNKKVEMKKLKTVFEQHDCTDVSTYINSGNVIFASSLSKAKLMERVSKWIEDAFGFEVATLVKTQQEMKEIAAAIPQDWRNDELHQSYVAYLFPAIDSPSVIDDLPFIKDYVDLRYVHGAFIWNVDRANYNKSHANKLIGHRLYKDITMRNVNTARYLAEDQTEAKSR